MDEAHDSQFMGSELSWATPSSQWIKQRISFSGACKSQAFHKHRHCFQGKQQQQNTELFKWKKLAARHAH